MHISGKASYASSSWYEIIPSANCVVVNNLILLLLISNKRIRLFTTTQLALGIISYHEELAYEALPEICNYMGPYRWSTDLNLFIDYYAPYEAVSVIHMVAQDKMRDNKKYKITILDEKDNFIQKSLRYSENTN